MNRGTQNILSLVRSSSLGTSSSSDLLGVLEWLRASLDSLLSSVASKPQLVGVGWMWGQGGSLIPLVATVFTLAMAGCAFFLAAGESLASANCGGGWHFCGPSMMLESVWALIHDGAMLTVTGCRWRPLWCPKWGHDENPNEDTKKPWTRRWWTRQCMWCQLPAHASCSGAQLLRLCQNCIVWVLGDSGQGFLGQKLRLNFWYRLSM